MPKPPSTTELERVIELIQSWHMALVLNDTETPRSNAMRKLLSELEEAMYLTPCEAKAYTDAGLEKPIELMHVFDTTCDEATQGIVNKRRYQSASLVTSEEAASPRVRLSFIEAGAPFVFGKRYRVTIEELP